MLEINISLVCHLLFKLKAYHAREVADINGDSSNPTDDMITATLAIQNEDAIEDPLHDEIKDIVEELDPDLKAELVAIMWIGREDYTANDWFAALDEAQRHITSFTTD